VRVRISTTAALVLALASLSAAAAQEPATAALIARAESFVDLLAAQQFSKAVAQFDATMKAALSEEQLKSAWVGLIAQAGAFKQRIGVRTEQRGTVHAVLVTCQFERSRQDVQVAFNPAGEVIGLSIRPNTSAEYKAPSYVIPGSFTEREVTVGGADWALPGTLTMPVATASPPAVVLVHGSGPNDRDETIGPNKPFRDLAHGLASQGIAVLRYDKRTRVHGARFAALSSFTVKDEVVDDALAAIELLRKEPGIDGSRIIVLGHSLGGTLVPRFAAADSRIAGFIVMAGLVRPLEEAILAQYQYLAMADGTVSPAEQKSLDDAQRLVDAVRALTPATATGTVGGGPAAYWLDLKGYDAAASARTIARPILVLQGERDYQVTTDDYARWKSALSGRSQATLRSYPALNHLFIEGVGKSLPAEYQTPGHVAEVVIQDITAWLRTIK
jgi:dienelactone hydrolase